MTWGNTIEKQRRLRIKLSLAAYAYEMRNEEIMSDGEFDKLCLEVDTTIDTGHAKIDKFFKDHFDPSTGSWIYKHPELNKVMTTYQKYY